MRGAPSAQARSRDEAVAATAVPDQHQYRDDVSCSDLELQDEILAECTTSTELSGPRSGRIPAHVRKLTPHALRLSITGKQSDSPRSHASSSHMNRAQQGVAAPSTNSACIIADTPSRSAAPGQLHQARPSDPSALSAARPDSPISSGTAPEWILTELHLVPEVASPSRPYPSTNSAGQHRESSPHRISFSSSKVGHKAASGDRSGLGSALPMQAVQDADDDDGASIFSAAQFHSDPVPLVAVDAAHTEPVKAWAQPSVPSGAMNSQPASIRSTRSAVSAEVLYQDYMAGRKQPSLQALQRAVSRLQMPEQTHDNDDDDNAAEQQPRVLTAEPKAAGW